MIEEKLFEDLYGEIEQLRKLIKEAAALERWEEVDLLLEQYYQIENEMHRRYLEFINIFIKKFLNHSNPIVRKFGEHYVAETTEIARNIAEGLYFAPERKSILIEKLKGAVNRSKE